MKIILFLALLLPCVSFARDIDTTINLLNHELAPKVEGQKGIEVEYRTENGHGWVNIMKLERKCKLTTQIFLEKGNLKSKTEVLCLNVVYDVYDSLYQISCETSESECRRKLVNQLTSDLIKKIANDKIKDVIVK